MHYIAGLLTTTYNISIRTGYKFILIQSLVYRLALLDERIEENLDRCGIVHDKDMSCRRRTREEPPHPPRTLPRVLLRLFFLSHHPILRHSLLLDDGLLRDGFCGRYG